MNKAYTYANFITESFNYQHSQEYYDYMKELAEIELMESYLTTQQFLLEEATEYSFVEGYLVETGDTDSVKTKLGEKAKNLLKKIWEGLKKAWSVFINFIKSIPSKVKGLFDRLLEAKAAVNLLFVAKTANDDPKGLSRLFKKYGDLIKVPDFYSGWNMVVTNSTTYPREMKVIGSNLTVGFNLKEFARVSSMLAELINSDKTDHPAVNVFFKFSSDRYSYFDEKASKAADIKYLTIFNAVSSMVDAVPGIGSDDRAMERLYNEITNNFTDTSDEITEVWVNIGTVYGTKEDILTLDQEFHKAIDTVEAKLNDGSYQINAEELKYFNEVNRAITWVFSEYMIASNHAMKLIADIAKFSGKVSAEYKTEQDKINEEYKNANNTAENDAE